ncbi:MAG: hypothetical protein JW849_07480, partial [Phycisphaerae bacterium]|nr:hypothetical protein [Phycisphaerae bacterium]
MTRADAGNYGEQALAHDAAGNLTYDGLYAYKYDAWNRLMTVTRAYPDPSDTTQHIEGSVVATMEYDGLGRRIVKAVDNSGDWDCTYNYYYNGQQMVEVQNGSG